MSAIAILVMLVLNFHQLNGASMHDHLQSLNQRQRRDVSNAADAQAAVDAHNRLRGQEARNATASNMEAMEWNSDVAALANNWALQCKWSHDPTISSMSPPVGQNLYAVSGETLNVTKAIEAWYNEKPDYNYDTLVCTPGKMCGHYTQVVWGTSYQVGCAAVFCPTLTNNTMKNATLYACDYRPAGNYRDTKPYTKGPVCTTCTSGKLWCTNGLCNSTCTTAGPYCNCQSTSTSISCSGHGTFNSNSCSCICSDGWTGPFCGDQPGRSAPVTRTSYSTTAIAVFVIGLTVLSMLNDLF